MSQHVILWRDTIREWYPEYEIRTHFVPSVAITRIPYGVDTVADLKVFVPKRNTDPSGGHVQESDTRDDLALQRVTSCLRDQNRLQNEPMFVVSRLNFSKYLEGGCPANAAKMLRANDLSPEYRRGQFDIMIIHRRYGILIGEIKSVLANKDKLQISTDDADQIVTVKVRSAMKQVDKAEIVLQGLIKDLKTEVKIYKTLLLPYVSAEVLRRAVIGDKQLLQELITWFDVGDLDTAIECCLLSDNLDARAPGTSSEASTSPRFRQWWSQHFAAKEDSHMTSDLYLDLLARFCGPATTFCVPCLTLPRVQVRTEGEGVAAVGLRMASLVLTPEQVSLLHRAPSKVLLTGPPGVGKSVMLVLMALKWMSQGCRVHLVSVHNVSLGVTHMMNHMILGTVPADGTNPPRQELVRLLEYDFYNDENDIDKAIDILTGTCVSNNVSQGPYVICDEFKTADSVVFDRYQRFISVLCERRPNICLWVASPRNDQKLEELQEERMTIPLRCPPAVLSEVGKAVERAESVYKYTTGVLASPCDGPLIYRLKHQGPGHTERWPLECVECGKRVAGILQQLLGHCVTDPLTDVTPSTSKATPCTQLQYRDIFVLTRSLDPRDDVKDDAGCVSSPANGFVRGLRDANIPVCVIGHESSDVCDMALAKSDVVTVASDGAVTGLERKVVVWLPHRRPVDDDEWTDEDLQSVGRFRAMSRCTAQLVVVDVPESNDQKVVAAHTRRETPKRYPPF